MKNKEEPKDLLAELEMLQRVLDNPTSSGSSADDIPVLDDLFDGNIPTVSEPPSLDLSNIPTVTDIPTVNDVASQPSSLRAVPKPQAPSPEAPKVEQSAPKQTPPSGLSPLNQILEKINRGQETESPAMAPLPGASETALSSKRAELDANMAETTASLTSLLQRERMVDELVEELIPMVKSRLRARVRDMLNGKEDT
ncbi:MULTISPECIES: hypothetical protein [Thalassolituus]|uniref:hypothetical protein n=1 Tax=Thalassolituus TaxID=187492 RepID=UPI000C4838BB|nr:MULTISPECIES: hypothetical protein [Thalassolituus]MAX85802.1 hypothetical protein [Oceanospirillaceae bacterium]MEC9411032.1 hypothetical protein [Pseudomonadota bacterium]|tara:strand:+ start:796 stop:1386 length:591 start_codon:yes stop_codon:yes gene_type:complete